MLRPRKSNRSNSYRRHLRTGRKNIELARLLRRRNLELEHKTRLLDETYQKFAILGHIGQEITSTIDFEVIFERLYRHVNALMDATVFSIDIYHPEDDLVEYRFCLEKNERLPIVFVPLADPHSLSAWCIRNRQEIVINNVEAEIQRYIPRYEVLIGEAPSSILYIPLMMEDRCLGAISVQSFELNAYSSYHQLILKTLASYTAIALSNAHTFEKLTMAFNHIELKNREIEHINESLTDSIRYASRIQEAILPRREEIDRVFPDNFILYKPRDIVSGDFYWFARCEGRAVLAVVDCTGHGVPGAFMSVMGHSLLNQIVNGQQIVEPGQILTQLNNEVRRMLKQMQSDSDSRDGMDVGLISVDLENRIIEYAGANRPLFVAQGGRVEALQADRYPIGGVLTPEHYTTQALRWSPGMTLYLTTDGYADQFGGPQRRKFLNRRLQELLQQTAHLPLPAQQAALEVAFDEWKGDNRQLDDILVIGLRL